MIDGFVITKNDFIARKCGVLGCKHTADYLILSTARPFPICGDCLKTLKKAINEVIKNDKAVPKKTAQN